MSISCLILRNCFSCLSSNRDEPQVSEEVERQAGEVPDANEPPAPKKRVISPEAKEKMLANLKRARELKAANRGANLKKYPLAKRQRAKEMYEQDVEEKAKGRAEELAKEMLRKQEEEKERAEFLKWRESKQKEAKNSDDVSFSLPKTKGKKAGKAPVAQGKETSKKKAPVKAKPEPEKKPRKKARARSEDEEDYDNSGHNYGRQQRMSYMQVPQYSYDMSQYLD